ncbi:hypothetical protein OAK83_01665 [bacterium]|nr:hypothetical protein [bacterium]
MFNENLKSNDEKFGDLLEEHQPQIWGTLHLGENNCGSQQLTLGRKLLIEIFNTISKHFAKNRFYFVRAVYSSQLHFHFFLFFPNNKDCEPRGNRTTHLSMARSKQDIERYFSGRHWLQKIKQNHAFPQADLDVQFYDSTKGTAIRYTTEHQTHFSEKLEYMDTSSFMGDTHFLYDTNLFKLKSLQKTHLFFKIFQKMFFDFK